MQDIHTHYFKISVKYMKHKLQQQLTVLRHHRLRYHVSKTKLTNVWHASV